MKLKSLYNGNKTINELIESYQSGNISEKDFKDLIQLQFKAIKSIKSKIDKSNVSLEQELKSILTKDKYDVFVEYRFDGTFHHFIYEKWQLKISKDYGLKRATNRLNKWLKHEIPQHRVKKSKMKIILEKFKEDFPILVEVKSFTTYGGKAEIEGIVSHNGVNLGIKFKYYEKSKLSQLLSISQHSLKEYIKTDCINNKLINLSNFCFESTYDTRSFEMSLNSLNRTLIKEIENIQNLFN